MEAELLFNLCNRFVLPAWLLLIVAPRWSWTQKIISHAWIPVLLGVAYLYAMTNAYPFPEGAGFSSLPAVMNAFTVPWLVVAGWIHYLAFDLFVGAWIARDSIRQSISHVLVIPCLVFTFLLGPVGLLLYLLVKAGIKRKLSTQEI